MSASIFDHPGRLAVARLLAFLLAACGSSGGDGGPDDRCFKVAQVPGWQIHMISSFADTGSVDTTYQVRLHANLDATGSTGPVQASHANPNGFAWFAGTPTGTIAAQDTVIAHHPPTTDTVVGHATGFGAGPSARVGPYLSVDLSACKATLGAIVYSTVTKSQHGHADVLDTLIAAYPFLPGIPIDSLFVANGLTVPSATIPSVLLSAPFGATGEYRVGGLSDPYDSVVSPAFDSATVSWTVARLASLTAPARRGAAAGFTALPNGAVLPPKR
jgi:hypothetical protein